MRTVYQRIGGNTEVFLQAGQAADDSDHHAAADGFFCCGGRLPEGSSGNLKRGNPYGDQIPNEHHAVKQLTSKIYR